MRGSGLCSCHTRTVSKRVWLVYLYVVLEVIIGGLVLHLVFLFNCGSIVFIYKSGPLPPSGLREQ
jgi:hypothetical protein